MRDTADTYDIRSDRTFTVAALAATRVDTVLPFVALLCWAFLVLTLVSSGRPQRRRRQRATGHIGRWYAPTTGPAVVNEAVASGRSADLERHHVEAATPATFAHAKDLPTRVDVVGHALAATQLDDLVSPVLRAGRRSYERSWGGVLLHSETTADALLLARATAGEHEVPLLTVRAESLVRSPISSAVESVFASAREHAPCMLLLTDLGELAGRDAPESRRVSSDLLTQLRQVGPSERIVVVGVVAQPSDVSRALRDDGGFDRTIAVGTLTSSERERIIRREILLHAATLGGDIRASVRVTSGHTASQLRAVVAGAVRSVRARSADSGAPPAVTARDLREASGRIDANPRVAPAAFGAAIARRLRRLVSQLSKSSATPAVALLGAPGNGKTAAARWVAERCRRRIVWLTGPELMLLTPEDVEAVVDGAMAQPPVLVVLDELDQAFAKSDARDTKHLLAAIEGLLAAPGVALLLTSSNRLTPTGAGDLDDLIETLWLRNPTFHERAALITHVTGDLHPSTVAALAAALPGASRDRVIRWASQITEQRAG